MSFQRDLFLGFVKFHILHHADCEAVQGLWLIEELARYAYELSAGTLYPMRHGLEEQALLACEKQVFEGKMRRT